MDAVCSKRPFPLFPHIKQVLIFHSLWKNIKNFKGLFEQQAKCSTTAVEGVVVMRNTKKSSVIFA